MVLLTEGVQSFLSDGLLTFNAITHGNVGGLMNLTRYPEQMRENVEKKWTHFYPVSPAAESLWNRRRRDD